LAVAFAVIDQLSRLKLLHNIVVSIQLVALIKNLIIPVQLVIIQLFQYTVTGSWHLPWRIYIFYSQKPSAALAFDL
jgi:hypothetical protein